MENSEVKAQNTGNAFLSLSHSIVLRLRGVLLKLRLYSRFLSDRCRISLSTVVMMEKDTHVVLGKSSRIVEMGKIVLKRGARLTIGSNTSIDRLCEIIIEENSSLMIGDNVFVGSHANFRVTGEIVIGDDCRIAQFVSLINGSYGFEERGRLIREQPYENGTVFVGEDVWLGLSVVVLPNTRIERGAVIGAGTIVSKDVAEYSIVVGHPQRVIGTRK